MVTNIDELTTGDIDGSGVFDTLMRSVSIHLEDQYKKGRIKGPDYASVYLGSIQSVIDQSIKYIMQKEQSEQQVELLVAQKTLVEEQTKTETAKTSEVLASTDRAERKLVDDLTTASLQRDAITKDIDVTERKTVLEEQKTADSLLTAEKQRSEIDTKITLMGHQSDEVVAGIARADRLADQEILNQQSSKLLTDSQIALTDINRTNAEKETDLKLLDIQLRTWSSAFNNSKVTNVSSLITNSSIDAVYTKLS